MSRQITPSTTLDNLRREAKRWLKALRAGADDARVRLGRVIANPPVVPTLRDVQHALALEHGLPGWRALKERLVTGAARRRYERVAEALTVAYNTGDEAALRIVWDYFGHMRSLEAMRRYVRLDLGRPEQPASGADDVITLDEAKTLVARAQEFESWASLAAFAATIPAGVTIAAKAVAAFTPGESGAEHESSIVARSRDWNEIIAVLQERRVPGLHASGQMTDEILARVSRLEHLTALDLNGSKLVSNAGLRHLARLKQLRHLNLGGCAITDQGLTVLGELPALESIELWWTPVTDEGMRVLSRCERLRSIDLGGTPTGDGAIRALAGKPALARFRSGNGVTNDGLAMLHDLPVFKSWHGGDAAMGLTSADAQPNYLLLRGTFDDRGMSQLTGLDGLFALNIDSNRLAVTGAGLAPLARLPHLEWLAFDATDESMPAIGQLPRLRFLLCQDTSASDDGFVALSQSRTLEYLWGRRCHNLRRRGFVALSRMPSLRHLSVSCLNVDDEGLSALPHFPALTELMPMDVPDAGYRHIGWCRRLQSLVLMYCRETSDAATEHLGTLPALEKYFASYNRITDRTPKILSGIGTLEEVTFDTCVGVTTAGVAALARLPRLRAVSVSGMPNVTREVVASFAQGVEVRWRP